VLVFGELRGHGLTAQVLVVAGSLVMIAGAILISRAEASAAERQHWDEAMARECERYGLDRREVEAQVAGEVPATGAPDRRRWWEAVIVMAAVGVFVWLAAHAERQPLALNLAWAVALCVATLALLVHAARLLWKRTRFS
jgi:hypothetical protein